MSVLAGFLGRKRALSEEAPAHSDSDSDDDAVRKALRRASAGAKEEVVLELRRQNRRQASEATALRATNAALSEQMREANGRFDGAMRLAVTPVSLAASLDGLRSALAADVRELLAEYAPREVRHLSKRAFAESEKS
jgi:hypothetical protein